MHHRCNSQHYFDNKQLLSKGTIVTTVAVAVVVANQRRSGQKPLGTIRSVGTPVASVFQYLQGEGSAFSALSLYKNVCLQVFSLDSSHTSTDNMGITTM